MHLDHSIPTRISEILISKICHDLVSPVGAVNNGVEFLTEVGADALQDGLSLIEHSARQASVRLQLFRMSYGAGGSDAKVTGKMIYETFQNYVAGTKTTFGWDLLNDMPDEDLPAGFMKTLLNMCLFVHEAMPKGGAVTIVLNDDGSMTVKGAAEMIKPKDGAVEAYNADIAVDDVTPKSVHGYITRAYADLYDLSLSHEMNDAEIILTIKF